MTYRPTPTAIVRHMQETARELGIVDLLLEHQRIVGAPEWTGVRPDPFTLVEEALTRLGVSLEEQHQHQQGKDSK